MPDSIPLRPTPAERHQMVAVAAYYLAERRGFAPGQAHRDWAIAERQIESMLAQMRQRGLGRETLDRTGLRNALLLWGDPG